MNEKLSSLKAGLFLLLLLASTLITAQIQSFQNGNWNTPSTWVGNIVPSQNDEVQINHQVTLSNFTYRNAKTTVVAGARLVLNQGVQHEFTNPAAFPDVSGVLEIGAGGYLTGNGPQYQVGSELYYASGGVYGRSIEWGWGADIYKPFHVTVKGGTSVNVGANGATNQELEIRGNLTVQANGNLYMDYGTDQMNQPLFVKGHTTVEGQLTLSNNAGGDIKINGDFTFGTNGRLFPKARAVIFTGLTGSIHNLTNNNTAVNPFVIPYLVYQPTSGLTTVNLLGATNYHISAPNGGAVIRHASGTSSRLVIGDRKLTVGTSVVSNYIDQASSTTYMAGTVNSELELLGNGELGVINLVTGGRNLKNLIMNRNHSGGPAVTFSGGAFTIANQLSLQNGVIGLGVNMYLGASATVNPVGGKASSFVISSTDHSAGVFRKNVGVLSNSAYSFKFPIGDGPLSDEGMQYSPITVDLNKTTSSSSGYITAEVLDRKASPDFDDNYLSRHWKVVMSGITNPAYDTTTPFYASDYVGTKMKPSVFYNDTGEWSQQGGNIKITDLTFSTKKLAYNVAFPNNFHLITGAEKVKKNEINVRGNGINIYSGDLTPQIYDNTDYGATTVGNTVTKTFRIENLGGKNLNIQNIVIQNENGIGVSADFSLLSGTSYIIATDSFVDVQIRFNALSPVGLKKARVFIDNNDSNESDYFYIIQGTVADFMACQGFSTIAIQNFEYAPAVPDYAYTVNDADTEATHIIAGGKAYVGTVLSEKYLGDRSLQVYNASSSVVFNSVNLSTANAPYLSLNLAALGYSANRGPTNADQVVVSVSTDGGLTWQQQIRIQSTGSGYRFWSFDGVPDFYDREYSATNPVSAPTVDASFKKNTYRIFNLPKVNSVQIKIDLVSNDIGRIWALDNVMLVDDTSQKTWNGAVWSGAGDIAPTANQKVLINGDYNTGLNGSFATCECSVAATRTLTIAADTYVTVENNITNNGELIVKSDGSLKQINKDAVNTGDIKVRREFTWSPDPLPPTSPRREYNYLSSPVVLVAPFTMKHIYGNDPLNVPFVTVLREPTNSFVNAVSADYDIPAKGFAVREARKAYSGVLAEGIASNEAQFKGKPNNGDITLPLSYTPGRGYNLAGNPYPSNLDINALYNDPDTKNIHPEFRFWDKTVNATYVQMGGAYQGYSYAIFNAATEPGVGYGVAAPGNDKGGPAGTKTPGSIIKVSQGFMVRANAVGAQLSFRNSMRRTTNAGTEFFGKESPRNRYRLQLVKADGFTIQNAIAYFDAGKTDFGIEDTRIPISSASDALFTYAGDAKVVINGRSSFTAEDVLTLGTRHYTAGSYTIQAVDEEGEFAKGQAIYLKDKTLGIITDLTKGDYSFTSEAGEYTNRFEIVYTPALVLATDSLVKSKLEVYRDATDFVVSSSEHPVARIEVYDASGRLVLTVHGHSKELRFSAERLLNGMYLLKAQLKNGEQLTKKIRK